MAQALVLNATYEPLTVVPIRRAVVLLVGNKAELVHAHEQRWHSAHLEVPVPTVIRLRRFVRVPYRRRTALSRRAVFARDQTGPVLRRAENLDRPPFARCPR
jgi:5-methylcytosine-specific restriction endonuclease McrA